MDSGSKITDLFPKSDERLSAFESSILVRSVSEEILEPIEGKISGKIPEWLNGKLIMNGPGTLTVGETKLNHLFDGMAILQKFTINSSGKVTFQNKFIRSEAYTKGRENNRLMFGEFGTAGASQSLFKKIMSFGKSNVPPTDNTVVSVYPISNSYYALTETPRINKIDPNTIDLIECVDLSKKFEVVMYTSHPEITRDGTAFNVGTSFKGGAAYNVVCFPKGENLIDDATIVAKIPARFKFHPSYMHSFGITDNFFIIIESPLTVSVPSLIKSSFVGTTFDKCFKWLTGEQTRILLIDRATGTLRHTFYTDPFFCFHTINQFEKNDQVIFDLICYKDGQIVNALVIEEIKKNDPEHLKVFESYALRFVMPLTAEDKNKNLVTLEGSKAKATLTDDGKVYCTAELLSDTSCEFPRVNYPKYMGTDYQYFYTSTRDGSIMKTDTIARADIFWKEENLFTWEPIYVPSPSPESEDDGVIVAGFLSNQNSNQVGIVILDAKNMKELARAEFSDLPTEITKSFHGWYVADE